MSSLAYLVTEAHARQRNGERPGQASFNALADFDAALAADICGGPDDPFHDDSRLEAFWLLLADEIGEA